jgi:CBS domain containing-hemolysin-like protein
MGLFLLALLFYCLVLAAEKALVSISPHELEALRASPAASAQRAAALGRQVRPALSALLLARLFLKICLIVFGAGALLGLSSVRELLYRWSERSGWPGTLVWALAAGIVALFFAVVFWALWRLRWPAADRSAVWLRGLSRFIVFWQMVFRPFLHREPAPDVELPVEPAPVTADSAGPEMSGEKREIELLRSIVKFGDTTVKQVMQPRTKIVAVDFRTAYAELLATVRESEFSRLPVYEEDLDNVVGILYVKDLVPHLEAGAVFEWQSLIRTSVLLVPESKRVIELLREFKNQKLHMAIVVDEYGGCSGIVTMEDILEEVTGEIRDEFDEESEVPFRKLDEYNFLFEGQTLLNDVSRLAGLAPGTFDEVRGDADTLAGLLLELRGDIPPRGAEITWDDYVFTVTAANSRRIEQVKLTLPHI